MFGFGGGEDVYGRFVAGLAGMQGFAHEAGQQGSGAGWFGWWGGGVGGGIRLGCCFGLESRPGCYPGLVHRCPSGTGVLGVGDWFLRVVGRKTGGIGGRILPGCCVGLEETRDGVTGCLTGCFCPSGTTIGLG